MDCADELKWHEHCTFRAWRLAQMESRSECPNEDAVKWSEDFLGCHYIKHHYDRCKQEKDSGTEQNQKAN